MSTKMMNVPVEKVEEAINGARILIENLREIQKSRVVILDKENGQMDDVFELLAKRVECGENLSDVVNDVEKGILVALIKKGYDHNVRLAEVLKTNPGNARQMLFQRGIKIKDTRVGVVQS